MKMPLKVVPLLQDQVHSKRPNKVVLVESLSLFQLNADSWLHSSYCKSQRRYRGCKQDSILTGLRLRYGQGS